MSERQSTAGGDPQVAGWTKFLSAWVARSPKFWRRLGNIETALLEDDLETAVQKPIYVGGLARSGSTLLLELLNCHPQTTTHRYRDFPLLYTPYWWNKFIDSMPQPEEEAQERAHGDRLLVTSESPEAMEEVLWMGFFSDLHDESKRNLLTGEDKNEDFDKFYRDHIRKLLAVRGGSRYLSKGNYNSTRIEYIAQAFPDALFVIPLRDPVTHIESLMRQHKKFVELHSKDRDLALHMERVGHFEFGAMRTLVNLGNTELIEEINHLWVKGEDARGWAKYWASIYGYIADLVESDYLGRKCLVVRFEDLCSDPINHIQRMAQHCGLENLQDHVSDLVAEISLPDYYKSSLTEKEIEAIWEEASETAGRFGYRAQN